jgi:hypothetical protein
MKANQRGQSRDPLQRMKTFMDLYWARHRLWRERRFREQMLRNRQAWQACSGIEDLGHPSCYRYLFDLPPERPKYPRFVQDVT